MCFYAKQQLKRHTQNQKRLFRKRGQKISHETAPSNVWYSSELRKGSGMTGEDQCEQWKCLSKTVQHKPLLHLSGTFTRQTIDIKENSELLDSTRNQIRFTTVLQVWVFIGSAYFIVITQMSAKRDIFTHHPLKEMSLGSLLKGKLGGCDSKGRRRKTCHERKENGCQSWRVEEKWKHDIMKGQKMKNRKYSDRKKWTWRDGGKDEKEEDEVSERRQPDKEEKKKWSIQVYNCFFHFWDLRGLFEGHWRDNHIHTVQNWSKCSFSV